MRSTNPRVASFRLRWSARGFVIVWTMVVIVTWNLVFDRVIVLAGRAYIGAATASEEMIGQPLLINSWMPPAIDRAMSTATAAAGAMMLVGLGIFTWADTSRSSTREGEASASPSGDARGCEASASPSGDVRGCEASASPSGNDAL